MKTLYRTLVISFVGLHSIYCAAQIDQVTALTTESNNQLINKTFDYDFLVGKVFYWIHTDNLYKDKKFTYYTGPFPRHISFTKNGLLIAEKTTNETIPTHYSILDSKVEGDTLNLLFSTNGNTDKNNKVKISMFKKDTNVIAIDIRADMYYAFSDEDETIIRDYFINKVVLDSVLKRNNNYEGPDSYEDVEFYSYYFNIKPEFSDKNLYKVKKEDCSFYLFYDNEYYNTWVYEDDLINKEPIMIIDTTQRGEIKVVNKKDEEVIKKGFLLKIQKMN